MTHNLTICIVTCRQNPQLDWVFNSPQVEGASLLAVSSMISTVHTDTFNGRTCKIVPPKTPYFSKHQINKSWTKSASLNTALCYCQTEWILFLDDRSILVAGFIDAVKCAMAGNYVMAGSYEKRTGIVFSNGAITKSGSVIETDQRPEQCNGQNPVKAPGIWLYGCVTLLPLEWALNVNGWSETWTNGIGFEDAIMGLTLERNNYPIYYDQRAKVIQDRTPGKCEPTMKKYPTPKRVKDPFAEAKLSTRSANPYDIRQLRNEVQSK